MKLKKIVDELNEVVKDFEQYKVTNHSDFHEKVKELSYPILQKYGLSYSRLWEISHGNIPVIMYNRDFEEYKNGKYAMIRQGKFKKVWFEIAIKTEAKDDKGYEIKYLNNLDLSEITRFVDKINTRYRLNNQRNYVQKLEKELKEQKEILNKME